MNKTICDERCKSRLSCAAAVLGLFGAGRRRGAAARAGAWSIRPARCRGGDIASLTQTLKDLETRKGSQIAVLIVPTTDGEAIEQFSLRVAEAWKIGRKKIDDGALLVIAKNDRRLRIEVGYGLEGALTDATTKRIIDEDITPKFKSGDFAGGISAGVDRMIRVDRRRETAGAGAAALAQIRGLFNDIDPFNPFVLVRRVHCRRHAAEHAGPAGRLGCDRRLCRSCGMALRRHRWPRLRSSACIVFFIFVLFSD